MWVTDSCYRNQRIVNNTTGKHLYFGPSVFYFTKDVNIFKRFGLETQPCDIRTQSVRKIGIDMEEAILQGVASMFPDVQHLYCVRHLMQGDEEKINCIFRKLDCRENERLRVKKEILSDIYCERRGGLYEYGLAESSDAQEFSEKLASLERKWERRCPGFFKWFNEKQKKVYRWCNYICARWKSSYRTFLSKRCRVSTSCRESQPVFLKALSKRSY